jgi:holin-like protein
MSTSARSDSAGATTDPASTRFLRFLAGSAAILACWGVGSLLAPLSPLPVPGSLIGMALLGLAVGRGWMPERWIRPAAEWLIRWMALFFVPAGVALMAEDALRDAWLPVVAGGAASTVAVLATVAWLHQRISHE